MYCNVRYLGTAKAVRGGFRVLDYDILEKVTEWAGLSIALVSFSMVLLFFLLLFMYCTYARYGGGGISKNDKSISDDMILICNGHHATPSHVIITPNTTHHFDFRFAKGGDGKIGHIPRTMVLITITIHRTIILHNRFVLSKPWGGPKEET